LLEAALLLEEHDAEALESGIGKCLAIFSDVYAKTAGDTGAGGDEQVFLNNLLRGLAFLVAKLNQVLKQVSHGEIGGIALAAIAEFLFDAK